MVQCPHCGKKLNESKTYRACPRCYRTLKTTEECVQVIRQSEYFEQIMISMANEKWKEANGLLQSVLFLDTDTLFAVQDVLYKICQKDWATNKESAEEPIKEQAPNDVPNDKNAMNHSQAKQSTNLTPCPACNNLISKKAEACPHCGQPTGVHVCPKCNSTNTKVISGASKATSVFLWGPFAANKVMSKFQCKDCGHKW